MYLTDVRDRGNIFHGFSFLGNRREGNDESNRLYVMKLLDGGSLVLEVADGDVSHGSSCFVLHENSRH